MPLQIDDLPPGLTLATLQSTLSDRIKNLNLILNGLMTNPATADLDMAQFLIHNLSDPVGDLDAVNLRTLKRLSGAPPVTTTAPAATTARSAYTIVSDTADTLVDGDVAPAYIVGSDRVGTPEESWIYAETAPVSACAINWQVQLAGVGPFQKFLSTDLVLPAGSLGPVFSSAIALRVLFPRGTVVKMVATTGGGAAGVSMGIVMKVSG